LSTAKRRQSLAVWWRALRFHYVPPSFLPAILGSVIAWATTGKFFLGYYLVVVFAVTLNHVALNMTDDYFDFKHSVDRARHREGNPYSGGSGLLTGGIMKPSHMRRAFTVLYLLVIAAGVYLTAARGWQVLLFGLVGMASAYFYTAPPLRYGYHGLGEVSQLVNFSLVIGLGAFFVQARSLSWEAVFGVLPLGFMMFSMITINEIPDAENDREGGKRTLVVRLGPLAGVGLYGAGMAIAYLIVLLCPPAGLTSWWTYLVFLTLPLLARALVVLLRDYRNPQAMLPANVLTIRIHNLTGILLIAAYVVRGTTNGRELRDMGIPLLVLVLLYLPVAVAVFSKPPGTKRAVGQPLP
jgi:1,4-dihydroxy-2-naphthoate octaprenyltransferase